MKIRPYVIVAPSHSVHTSVRALHRLCHELCALGFDAQLLLTPNPAALPGPTLDPALRTPTLNARFEQDWPALNEQAIVVCADSVPGVPFGARRLVRYVLGKEAIAPADDPQVFTVYFSRAFPADKRGRHPVLFQFDADLADFNDTGTAERTQDMLWLGHGAALCPEPPPGLVAITQDWPPTRAALAAQLRKTRHLYSWDARSAINAEAILCGAVPVIRHFGLPQGAWTRKDLEATEHGSGGFAYGDSDFDLDRARRTRQELVDSVRYQQAMFRPKLLEFVELSQRHFR